MLSQDEMKERFLPLLKAQGVRYKKTLPILARPATVGEEIKTITDDGLETINVAETGDFIVQNQTDALEEYIVSSKTFEKRYIFMAKAANGYDRYQPKGEVLACELDHDLLENLGMKDKELTFKASWGTAMTLKVHDFVVCPPDFRSVYRIARKEFFETYTLVAPQD